MAKDKSLRSRVKGNFQARFCSRDGGSDSLADCNKPDDNGIVKPINYYSLKWSWSERSDWSVIDQAAAVLSDTNNLSRMIDLEGTRQMVCLDNLPPHEIACLIAAHARGDNHSIALNSNGNTALLTAAEKETSDLF